MEEHEHCSCVDPLLAELARVAREVEAGRWQGRDHRAGIAYGLLGPALERELTR